MTTAEIAHEMTANIGQDVSLSSVLDETEYLDTEDVEDIDLMTVGQRQALNAAMADYFNG
jgi:hypothetical protein